MSFTYLHVPKTGGISVTWEMRKLGRKSPYTFYLGDKSETEDNFLSRLVSWYPGKSDLGRYDLLSGHGAVDTFVAAGADAFATVLREPRSRLLSSYFYIGLYRGKLDFLPSSLFDRDLFVADGERLTPSLLDYIRASDRDANPVHTLCAPGGARDTQAVVERLRAFEAVGFTENHSEFVGWLSERFQIPLRTDRRLNVTRLKEEGAVLGGSVEEIVRALDEKTAPDAEVYRWAAGNRREGFSAPPDPDETLERTLARFKIV